MSNVDVREYPIITQAEEERTSGQMEAEVSQDVRPPIRQKIIVPADTSMKELQEKFGVSRTTAWRARQRGWLYQLYHQKVIDPDLPWAEQNSELLMEDALKGAKSAVRRLGMEFKELGPFELGDLVHESYIRLVELSGLRQRRENPGWRVTVARNTATGFIKSQIIGEPHINADIGDFSESGFAEETPQSDIAGQKIEPSGRKI